MTISINLPFFYFYFRSFMIFRFSEVVIYLLSCAQQHIYIKVKEKNIFMKRKFLSK